MPHVVHEVPAVFRRDALVARHPVAAAADQVVDVPVAAAGRGHDREHAGEGTRLLQVRHADRAVAHAGRAVARVAVDRPELLAARQRLKRGRLRRIRADRVHERRHRRVVGREGLLVHVLRLETRNHRRLGRRSAPRLRAA